MSSARLDLTDEVRRLLDHLANAAADAPATRRATQLLRQAVAELNANDGKGANWRAVGRFSDERHHAHFLDASPFTGRFSPLAPPIALRVEDDEVIGDVVYGRPYEGPPGFVHGGFIAGGFDEVLGYAQARSDQPGMTGRLTIGYRSPTPLHTPLQYRARLTKFDGRKNTVTAELRVAADDRLCAEATGLFIALHPHHRQRLWPAAAGEGATPPPG